MIANQQVTCLPAAGGWDRFLFGFVTGALVYAGVDAGFDGVELPAYRTLTFPASRKDGLSVAVGDVNGDGYGDLIVALPTSGQLEVCRSTGVGFSCLGKSGLSAADLHIGKVADFAGDGAVHVLSYDGSTSLMRVCALQMGPSISYGPCADWATQVVADPAALHCIPAGVDFTVFLMLGRQVFAHALGHEMAAVGGGVDEHVIGLR